MGDIRGRERLIGRVGLRIAHMVLLLQRKEEVMRVISEEDGVRTIFLTTQ